MTIHRAAIFIFTFVTTISWSQGVSQSLNYRLNITRFDFFTGIEYARNYNAFHPNVAFEVGINRTIFQERFFPKISVGFTYDLLKNEKIVLGPTMHTSYSILNVNRNSDHFHQWKELMVGVRLETGKKWKYIFNSEYGIIGETYFDQNKQGRETVTSFGYVISMGIGYAW